MATSGDFLVAAVRRSECATTPAGPLPLGWFTQMRVVNTPRFHLPQRLIDAGVDASIGSVCDGYDNALAESTIGLYKTELVRRQGPWKTLDQPQTPTQKLRRTPPAEPACEAAVAALAAGELKRSTVLVVFA